MIVYTIGHSTHPLDEFIATLQSYHVRLLVDVRTVPRSRHTPQFNSPELAASLAERDIDYLHLSELGGLRHAHQDSVNTGWRNASFRGYADHMQTAQFAAGVDRLVRLAGLCTTAIMCAEAVPWRCHRSLIGDALLVRGIEVRDIMDATHWRPESLTTFARVAGTDIRYPAPDELEPPGSAKPPGSAE
ncbi:MAG TPA: DUF488 domain-containing protein [Humibacter sp.]|nr:DUF488 domain-containing protein [Humibacter sp.]